MKWGYIKKILAMIYISWIFHTAICNPVNYISESQYNYKSWSELAPKSAFVFSLSELLYLGYRTGIINLILSGKLYLHF